MGRSEIREMSISAIKKLIAALPSAYEDGGDDGIKYSQDECILTPNDLKALAASHDELLSAVRNWFATVRRLALAIEQAGK